MLIKDPTEGEGEGRAEATEGVEEVEDKEAYIMSEGSERLVKKGRAGEDSQRIIRGKEANKRRR
jgi:hypothetical protein